MGKPLSTDLCSRLVSAVMGGLSRRAAAKRFGVSAASAVRWVQANNITGSVCAKPQGGDTRSHHVEAFSDTILSAVEAQKDISLVELAALLRTRHGVSLRGQHGLAVSRPPRDDLQKNSARRRAGTPRRRRECQKLGASYLLVSG